MAREAGFMRRIPDAQCAHRAQLTSGEKRVYDQAVAAMCALRTNVTIIAPGDCDYKAVFEAIKWDQPYLYYVDFSQKLYRVSAKAWIRLTWKMSMPPVQVAQHDAQIACALCALAPPGEGDMLRNEIRLHDALLGWGICPVRGGPGGWEDHCIIGPLLRGHTVCEGMALLFTLLCLRQGIPCMLAAGMGREDHHAWNMVKIDGRWMHVDAYWNLCLSACGIRRDYLNLDDEEMRADHSWNENRYPACPGGAKRRAV